MTILGERTKQLDILCRVTGFTNDFLSFIVVELIRFFHGALQLSKFIQIVRAVTVLKPKPKTAVLRRNRTETEPRFSRGHVTVFLEFQKMAQPGHKRPQPTA